MVVTVKQVLDAKLADDNAERVRKSVADAIREIQAVPVLAANVIKDVSLPNGSEVEVAHGLGRRPNFVSLGVVRGAAADGRIGEIRGVHSGGQPIDASKYVCLQAVDYGATITVDVMVW